MCLGRPDEQVGLRARRQVIALIVGPQLAQAEGARPGAALDLRPRLVADRGLDDAEGQQAAVAGSGALEDVVVGLVGRGQRPARRS